MGDNFVSNSPRARPMGVTIWGVLLIASSILHIQYLAAEHDTYMHIHGYLPPWLLMLRYAFSWFQRILGLAAAVGILFLKDIGRKLAILIGCFTILTIYWKHSYAGFRNHAAYLDQNFGFILKELGYPQLSFSQFTSAAVIVAYTWDILFFGLMIYYLTRPSVKAQFKPNRTREQNMES